MKNITHFILVATTLVSLTSCGDERETEKPVAQTFVHKYGVEVAKSDWESRGKDGQIVSKRKDGVAVVRNYQQGKLEGETTYSFPHSNIIAKVETYHDGNLVGIRENYQSGSPQLETKYLPFEERMVTSWYSDGTPHYRETYRGLLLYAGEYFSPRNTVESRVSAGDGMRIVRNEEGILASEDRIGGGQLISRTTFYTNGEPESITCYRNNKPHGERKTYYVGGLPNAIESWVDGELHGNVTIFANGEMKAVIPYDHGHRHGTELCYGPEGEVVEEIHWLRDRKHGADLYYLSEGTKADWYHHGQLVSKAIFDRLNPSAG